MGVSADGTRRDFHPRGRHGAYGRIWAETAKAKPPLIHAFSAPGVSPPPPPQSGLRRLREAGLQLGTLRSLGGAAWSPRGSAGACRWVSRVNSVST